MVSKISIENDEMTSSAARAACAVFAAFLLIGTAPSAQTRINTPFQVISLWSEDMVRYLIGERQPACSGEKLADCKRINPGVCDATVDVAFGKHFPWCRVSVGLSKHANRHGRSQRVPTIRQQCRLQLGHTSRSSLFRRGVAGTQIRVCHLRQT